MKKTASAPSRSDRIDETLAALRRACPDIDFAPLALFARLVRLGRLVEAFNDALLSEDPLSFTDVTALTLLKAAGTERLVTPGDIGMVTLRSSPGITAAIDRLEKHGLVRRVANSRDRRSVYVELTARGHRRCERFLRDAMSELNDLLAGVGERDRERAEQVLRVLLEVLERWWESASGGSPQARGGSRRGA